MCLYWKLNKIRFIVTIIYYICVSRYVEELRSRVVLMSLENSFRIAHVQKEESQAVPF